MGELIEQCSILADMQSSRPVTERDVAFGKTEATIAVDQAREVKKDPPDVEQSDVKMNFEEAMEAFHNFILSENVELKNASVQTEGSAQTFESCVDPANASCIIEEPMLVEENLYLCTVSTQTGHANEETTLRVEPTENPCDSAETLRREDAAIQLPAEDNPIPSLMSVTLEPRMIAKFKTLMSLSRFPLVRGFAGGNPPVRLWYGTGTAINSRMQNSWQPAPGGPPMTRKTFDPGAPQWRRPFPQPYGNGGVQNQNHPWRPPVIYHGTPEMNRYPFPRPNFPFAIQPLTMSPPIPFPGYFHQVTAPIVGSIPPTTGGWSTGVYSPALRSQQLRRMLPSC
jgi:hypothetical protein